MGGWRLRMKHTYLTLQRTYTAPLALMAEQHPPSLTLLGDTLKGVFLVVVSCQRLTRFASSNRGFADRGRPL